MRLAEKRGPHVGAGDAHDPPSTSRSTSHLPRGRFGARRRMLPAMRRSLTFGLLFVLACGDGGGGERDAGALDAARVDASAEEDASVRLDGGDGGDEDGGAPDASTGRDGGIALDGGTGADAGSLDAGTDAGMDGGPRDSGPPDSGPPDSGPPAERRYHVHIDVDNFCNMAVDPMEITIPAGQTAYFDWHNHSRDYPVDVWMSYGGGYLDLATGATWEEPIGHCIGPRARTEYADISTACSDHRFLIRCE